MIVGEKKSSKIKDWAALIAAVPGLILACVTAYTTFVDRPEADAKRQVEINTTYEMLSPGVRENRLLIIRLSKQMDMVLEELTPKVEEPEPASRETVNRYFNPGGGFAADLDGIEALTEEKPVVLTPPEELFKDIKPLPIPNRLPTPTRAEIDRAQRALP